jgi:hypothetical protein
MLVESSGLLAFAASKARDGVAGWVVAHITAVMLNESNLAEHGTQQTMHRT